MSTTFFVVAVLALMTPALPSQQKPTTPLSAAAGEAETPIPEMAREAPAMGVEEPPTEAVGRLHGAESLVAGLEDEGLAAYAREVLERNPELARARAAAAAAALEAPQVRSLPDPMAALSLFVLPPETRVGPQRLMAGLSQKLPWFGKLAARERAAMLEAAAVRAEVAARELALVTEARRLYRELAFVDAQERVVREERSTLGHYEEIARARYASGVGLGQAPVKIQAEITKTDTRLLEIGERRRALSAAANALRERSADTPLPTAPLPGAMALVPRLEEQRRAALARRPELAAADARIAAAGARVELAERDYRPDVTLGLSYTVVGRREDRAGRLNPPEGNGDDILGLSAGINLPVWKKKLDAGLAQAVERRRQAEAGRRVIVAGIKRTLGDLAQRIPLTRDRLRLFEDVLRVQAEESLRLAEAAYAAGTLNALDLLDAERVLLDVRVAIHRARADLAIAKAELEGAVGAPVKTHGISGDTP